MTTLKQGFHSNDIKLIQEVLGDKKINLLGDTFITQYLDELLRSVRLNAVAAICKPYKTVKLAFLARKMNVPVNEIRGLLSELILEEKLERAASYDTKEIWGFGKNKVAYVALFIVLIALLVIFSVD